MRGFWAVALALVATSVAADEVLLRNGGRLSGVVVEDTPERVVIEIGPGRVTLTRDRVLKVVSSASALAEYRRRAAAAGADAEAWSALARWAEDQRLQTQASAAWERVLKLQPQNTEAHLGLGHVQVGGRWLTEDDAYAARGYVRFEGRWMQAAERDGILSERRAAADANAAAAERDARVREAEARARAAEAEARAAEAKSSEAPEGIPLGVITTGSPWGYGPWGYPPPPRPRPVVIVRPAPVPSPLPPSHSKQDPESGTRRHP